MCRTYPVARNQLNRLRVEQAWFGRRHARPPIRIETLEVLIRGHRFDNPKKSPRLNRRLVWWRRRELNPGPKIVSALRLHV